MSNEDTVKQLVELLTKQNEFLSTSGPHAQDAVELKKEWFRHVLKVLEQANLEIDDIKKDLHRVSEDGLKRSDALKDTLRNELEIARSKITQDINKMEARLDKEIDDLYDKQGRVDNTALRNEFNEALGKHKTEYREDKKDLETYKKDLREKDLDPIKKQVIIMSVKTALITTGIGAVLLLVIRYFFNVITGHPLTP